MTPLLLLRHASTQWNAERRIQGSTDIPLSAEGRAAAAGWRLPAEFKDYRWVASPLGRAMETARLMGAKPKIERRLVEMDWGQWEGLLSDELEQRFPQAIEESARLGVDFRRPGGESPRDVQQRLQPWLASLTQPTAAVTHQGVITATHALAAGWNMVGKPPVKLARFAAHLFMIDAGGAPSVERLNIPLEVNGEANS